MDFLNLPKTIIGQDGFLDTVVPVNKSTYEYILSLLKTFTVIILLLFIIRFLYLLLDNTKHLKEIEINDLNKTIYSVSSHELCDTGNFDDDQYLRFLSNIEEKVLKINTSLRDSEINIVKGKKKITTELLNKSLLKIDSIYQYLCSTDGFLFKKRHLEELNDRMTFYYRYMNDKNYVKAGSIPIIQISKHHHAVEYMYNYIKETPGTILHVDSHADMNEVKNNKAFFRECVNSKKLDKDQRKRFQRLITDIGGVLVPMLLPYNKNNGVFWLTPDWVTEPFNSSSVKLSSNEEFSYFYGGTCPKYTVKEDRQENLYDDNDIDVQFTTSNIKYASIKANNISNNYILNIDLDYFVTYGGPSYGHDGLDAISDYRTKLDCGYAMKDPNENEKKERELLLEQDLILKRIDNFFVFLKHLKSRNKLPSMIIICDSTCVDYCNYNYKNKYTKYESEMNHEFMPKYFSFWVHNIVLLNLVKMFS
jgi:hypothetical protein